MDGSLNSKKISLNGGYGNVSQLATKDLPAVCWSRKVSDTRLEKFQKIIEAKYNVKFRTYWDFQRWTIENHVKFWEELWNFIEVICSKPYKEVLVKTGPGFLDNDWFSGAKFNFAENILRIRDDSIALICVDERGNEDFVTYSELFEEVKLYSAAFRRNGLQKNDTVACYMSNRKEAVFAMLAVASIGAIWGGPLPFSGGRVASKIIKMMDPKFLITIDTHQFEGKAKNLIDSLNMISENVLTLQKIILLVSEPQHTLKKDLSCVQNLVFLEDFLEDGRTVDGNVPDILFEQLPASHPLVINFTSGTTGLCKGAVHSAVSLISVLRDFVLHLNLKKGDVVCSFYPVGWSLWDYFIPVLSQGCKLLLYCGDILHIANGINIWDIHAKYKVKLTYLATSVVDRMEKLDMVPSPSSNFESLEIIGLMASPVKAANFQYLHTKIKKNVFICNIYGATEVFGAFSGINLNMPAYVGEVQAPSLGMDIQCFDDGGNSVIGQRGELVVCTPAPNFPIGLWKDVNNCTLNATYFTKYPRFWSQNDECWINPKTNGIVVTGRSDDTMIQLGDRFGSEDIYFAIHPIDELQDYICVGQNKYNGDSRAILFVKLKKGVQLTKQLKGKIEHQVECELFHECVPQLILEVPDIPYNLNNKRMERIVRKIVANNKIPEVSNIKNPESLKYFLNIPEVLNYNQI